MLKRKVYQKLIDWKKTKKNKCLLIKGARQIGKTFIVDYFGRNEYKNYIYINFLENESYKKIFEDSLTASDIYTKMSIALNIKIDLNEKDTLIFLDEIQECPRARTALKFLAIDDRFDIIASGSLLGIYYNVKNVESIPVGYETTIEMSPLDFEEFLWAKGIDDAQINIIKDYYNNKRTIEEVIHNKYMQYLREYMFIGGMPEVINCFNKTNNYQDVINVQNDILEKYKNDIMHYANNTMKQKIEKCYYSIPVQLSKENKKFKYTEVDTNASARKYEESLNWLLDAGFIKKCENVSLPQIPLVSYAMQNEFKMYLGDIGLITCMYGIETKRLLINDELKGHTKGGIFENFVFLELSNKYKVYYYKLKNSQQEIEFIIEKDGEVVPIEVKSKNGSTISLNNFIQNNKTKLAYKLVDGNIGFDGKKITLPHYMAMFV